MIEFIRNEIKELGFLSATRVSILVHQRGPVTNDELEVILKSLVGDGIHRVTYTNKYVHPYATKKLYVYNPNRVDKKRQRP